MLRHLFPAAILATALACAVIACDKGKQPPAFDLLYRNADGTRLARDAHGWYIRNTYLENNLIEPGKVEVMATNTTDADLTDV